MIARYVAALGRYAGLSGVWQKLAERQAEADRRLLGEIASWQAELPPVPTGSRRLVMGLSAHYGAAELAPFVTSLRGTGYQGEIVLLGFGMTAETRRFLDRHGVRVLPFLSVAAMPMSMNSARMIRYLEILLGEALAGAEGHDWIMLSDVRDVIFQHDPFAGLGTGEILFCLESDRTLGSCPINANWTRLAFGPEVLREFADRPVSCAGTLFARPAALVSYLLHMTRAIAETRPETRHSGIDQAIHNVILNRGLVAGTRALPNGEVVLTVPADAEARYAVDAAGDILAPSGAVPAVVHQYDRNPALLRHVRERFGGG